MARKTSTKSSSSVKFLLIVLLAIAVPFGYLLSRQQAQPDYSQSTAVLDETTSVTPPTCNASVTKITLEGDCGPNKDNLFRKATFVCRNGYSGTLDGIPNNNSNGTAINGNTKNRNVCRPAGQWLARANSICRENTPSCKSLTPTPTPCTNVSQAGFTYGESCQGGYKSVDYTCSDNSTGTLEAPEASCVGASDWNKKVREACASRGTCHKSPTPKPTSCTPVTVASGSGPDNRCAKSGYKNFKVKCSDGHEETLTDTNGTDHCTSLSEWQARAKNLCLRRTSCPAQ